MQSKLNAAIALNTTAADAADLRADETSPAALRPLSQDELAQVAGGMSPETPSELPVSRW